MTWKPDGYPSASPYLFVRDAEETLRFLETVFGATRLRVIPRDGGGIMHAEAQLDDSVIMMGEVPGGADTNVHVYVPDAAATLAKALAAGATVVQPVEDKGDGDLRGGVADGNGAVWWIATQKAAP
ncbi:VOC family protein [Mesobacterium pallidum]|uniref:VOC family protein n=1 Tax=Mesobacterium pallidum TaxID=2872037 RepID=UPI001EE364A7|nr:VOC family protein [Mesobacterium pallidum]